MRHGMLSEIAVKDGALRGYDLITEDIILKMLNMSGVDGIISAEFCYVEINPSFFQPRGKDALDEALIDTFPAWEIKFKDTDKTGIYRMFNNKVYMVDNEILTARPAVDDDIVKCRIVNVIYESCNLQLKRLDVSREYIVLGNTLIAVRDFVYKYEHHDTTQGSWRWPASHQLKPMSVKVFDKIEIEKFDMMRQDVVVVAALKLSLQDSIQGFEIDLPKYGAFKIKPEYMYACLDKDNSNIFFDETIKAWLIPLKRAGEEFVGVYLNKMGRVFIFPRYCIDY